MLGQCLGGSNSLKKKTEVVLNTWPVLLDWLWFVHFMLMQNYNHSEVEVSWLEFIIISRVTGQAQLPYEYITSELFPYIHLLRVSPK